MLKHRTQTVKHLSGEKNRQRRRRRAKAAKWRGVSGRPKAAKKKAEAKIKIKWAHFEEAHEEA